ncbi:hypothetical protein ACLEPN_07895 [Myxococcus sp. 1LA]
MPPCSNSTSISAFNPYSGRPASNSITSRVVSNAMRESRCEPPARFWFSPWLK